MKIEETDIHNFLVIDTIKEMIGIAKEKGVTAKQDINNVIVLVNGDSDPELVFRDQQRAQEGCIRRKVGPYPNTELTEEEKENDLRIIAENERYWKELSNASPLEEIEIHKKILEEKLLDAPEFEVIDKDQWQEIKDRSDGSYYDAIIVYAENWARLMQAEINGGQDLEDIAARTSWEANRGDYSGGIHEFAKNLLSKVWIHKEELSKWNAPLR